MKIDIQLSRVVIVLVAVFIEDTGSFTVSLTHQIVLCLSPKTKSFSCARVAAVPGLSSTNVC
jgi:hypothetical protein